MDDETIFWIEEKNQIKIQSLSSEGELRHRKTISCEGINAQIIDNNLNRKEKDGYFILTEEENRLEHIDD